ncbi:MAG TPA: response regulator, partial [Polyangiaceae bacterium]
MPIKILVFESDAGFAEQLRVGFAALGCETTVVDDANLGLQAASREKPDLILLSIELPRMNGFSVCNKLKRDAALKDVPLIIMSSESTEETFEQHRRLRTRAEDYVHKPIGFDNLLTRIQPFVAIAGAPAADEPAPETDDAIVMDDDIEIDDSELVDDAPEVETSSRESMVDQDVSDFADQAFGALESPPASALPDSEVLMDEPEITEPEVSEPEVAEPEIAEPEIAEPEIAEPEIDEPAAAARASQLSEPEITEVEVDEAEVTEQPLSLADIEPLSIPAPTPNTSRPPMPPARVPSLRPSNLPRAADLGDTSKYREEAERLRARIKELEDEARAAHTENSELQDALKRGGAKDSEVQRLERELSEVKAKQASGGGKGAGTAREFLDLREQLNKKDKEILETRDQLSHKDK